MLDQPNNSLHDFVAALDLFKPDLILTEVRPEFPGAVEGSIDGGPEQSLVYAFASHTNTVIIPVDWFDDQFTVQSERESKKIDASLKSEIDPLFEKFRKIVQTGTFAESQDSETQALIRARYDLIAKNGFTAFENRNKAICNNIRKHKDRFNGKRVLVVFGLAHKYYLDDCLQNMGIQTLTLKSWYNSASTKKVKISEALKQNAVKNFEAARSLLSRRLTQGYYKVDIENLKDKLAELDSWIERTKKL
jgi:hypothetical protein